MKVGDFMIKEFINESYRYVLSGPILTLSKVKLNGVDVTKYLTNKSKVSWYDVSKNSGRDTTNADGTMVLNVIATKYRLDLVTRPLTEDELVDFFSEIIKSPTLEVEFLNPFDKQWKTIQCYRGDRIAQSMLPYETEDGLVELYNPITQALIEL